MKKFNLFASCLLLGSIICGCSCDKESVDTKASVSYENQTIVNNRGGKFTVGEVYEHILANQQDAISKELLTKILEAKVDLENDEDMLFLYKKYLNEHFEETFVNSDAYKYNGEFSEDLVVKYLNNESYVIKCENSNDLLDNVNFSCNYSDYIRKNLNYDLYMKMLKLKHFKLIEKLSNL